MTEPKILLAIFITLLLFDFALSYENKNKTHKKKKAREKENILIKEISTEEKTTEQEEKPKKKTIESENLLELTRKINIDEINSLLEGTEYKLEKKEINNIKKEISKVEKSVDMNECNPIFTENERKALEYTLRLDLNAIQKKIKSKIK